MAEKSLVNDAGDKEADPEPEPVVVAVEPAVVLVVLLLLLLHAASINPLATTATTPM